MSLDEAVNAYGPPSLSSITLSIPPFLSSIPAVIAPAPPPPPPPPPATLIDKASHVLHTTGRVIARNKFKLIVGVVGLGILGGVVYDQRGLIGGYLYSLNARRKEKSEGGMRLGSVARRSRTGKKGRGKGGRVEEGMLKDAIRKSDRRMIDFSSALTDHLSDQFALCPTSSYTSHPLPQSLSSASHPSRPTPPLEGLHHSPGRPDTRPR